MINRNINASAKARGLLARLEGTRLELEVRGLMRLCAAAHDGHLSIMRAEDDQANAALSGSAGALLMLLRESGPKMSATAAMSGVSIRGDAEVANLYKELLVSARPDLEEELSRFIGDMPARQVSRAAASVIDWLKDARRTAGQNIAEYLTEESRDLVSPTELEEFLASVDVVREAADRFEARLRVLELRARSAG
jgi:ubiquinone biosynthesis protein UbiJ